MKTATWVRFTGALHLQVEIRGENDIRVKPEVASHVGHVASDFASHRADLFQVPFTSLNDYLHWLRALAEALSTHAHHVMFYLAAAVSDFYIPADQMPEHKIQTSEGNLELSLQLVPKMLEPLVVHWCPLAFIVSFKLETDPKILVPKAKGALLRYRHELVIGNILERRKKEVILVSAEDEMPISLSDAELGQGVEIEAPLVAEVARRHEKYIAQNA